MKNNFQLQLIEYINSTFSSLSDVVYTLKDYEPDLFSGLDVKTLTRWINGETHPSLKKKLCVLTALKCDVYDFILNHSEPISIREDKKLRDYLYKLDSRMSPGYVKITEPVIKFNIMKKNDIRDKFDLFYLNNSAYINIRNTMDQYKEDYAFNVYCAYMQDTLVGHLAYTDTISNSLINTINLDMKYRNYIGVIPACYINSKTMVSLFAAFSNDLIHKANNKKSQNVIMFISNPISAMFFESNFKAKLLRHFPKSKSAPINDYGLYLFEFNVFDILSSSIVFNNIKDLISDNKCNRSGTVNLTT